MAAFFGRRPVRDKKRASLRVCVAYYVEYVVLLATFAVDLDPSLQALSGLGTSSSYILDRLETQSLEGGDSVARQQAAYDNDTTRKSRSFHAAGLWQNLD